MNAITPTQTEAEERSARQLRICRRLSELGMELAELAAAKATAQAAADQAPAKPNTPARRFPDPSFLFVRLAASIRQAIVMENRIAAGRPPGALAARPRNPAPQPQQDPRFAPVTAALEHALADHPDRATLQPEAAALVEQFIAEYPDAELPVHHLFELICGDLRIDVEWPEPPDG